MDPPTGEQVDESFPRNKFTPCEALSCLHSRQPLQGSISGAHPIFGMNGERLTHVFPDLSHMGVGVRHVGKVFVDLPAMYTDLYQMVGASREIAIGLVTFFILLRPSSPTDPTE